MMRLFFLSFKQFWIQLALLMFFVSLPDAWPQKIKTEKPVSFNLPDLSTDEKRLQWLLSVRENIPGLFAEAAKYDIDLLHLLEDQEKIQKLLIENPEYLKAMENQHPSWLTVTISPKSAQVIKTFRINPKAIEAWKKSIQETLNSIPVKKSLSEELLKEISAQFKKS